MLPIPFLKKGQTGILDKGIPQDRIFFFFLIFLALTENIQKKAKVAYLSNKGLVCGKLSEYVN